MSIARRFRLLAAAAAIPLFFPVPQTIAAARDLIWDPLLNGNTTNGVGSDGGGTWDPTGATMNWAIAGSADVGWSNTNPDNAIFGSGGTAGTVDLSSNATVGNLTFNSGTTGSYIINAGTNALIMSGGTITLNANAEIDNNLQGSAVVSGTGTLTLGGTADNSGLGLTVNTGATVILAKNPSSDSPNQHAIGGGGLTIAGGTVDLGGTGGAQIFNGAAITINSGTFNMQGENQSVKGISGTGGIVQNNLSGTSVLTLTSNTGTYSGVIQDGSAGTMAVTIAGAVQTLSGSNTYSGPTMVTSGVLRANTGAGLSPNSNVVLNGGVIEAGTNFTQTLGTGAGQLQITGGTSGFSALGAAINVNLNSGASLQWGSATFSPSALVLDETTANNTITFQNPLDLNAATRTVNVNANTATVSGAISNSSGTAGLTKGGAGTLVLSNASNSYNGTTTISGGTLSVSSLADGSSSLIGGGGIALTGGTLLYTGTGDTSTRSITASTGNSTINVQNAAATLTLNPTTSITGSSTTTLTMAGAGTLVLGGTVDNSSLVLNASSGTTVLSKQSLSNLHAVAGISNVSLGATVQFSNAAGAGTNQVFGGTATGAFSLVNMSGGSLDLNGTNQSWDRLSGYGTITNNGASGTTSTLSLGTANGTGATFSGNITDGANGGKMALATVGSGVQILAAANTYSGATSISGGGTLRLAPATPVGGAAMWLDASNTSSLTVSGGKISAWNDLSGNGRNATQATSANQPIYTTNATLGGKNVVRFNASGQVLNFAQGFLANTAYTIFSTEAKADGGATSANPYYYLGTETSATNQGLHFGYRSDTDFTLAQYSNDIDYTSAPAFTTQQFREWSGQLNTATGGGHFLFLNGTQVQSSTNTTPLSSPGTGAVGEGYSGATSQYKGDLGEILIYTYALTAAQRAVVDSYLQGKWEGSSANFNVLPSGTTVTIAANSTLDLNGYNQTVGSISGPALSKITLGSIATAALSTGSAGTTTFSGIISGSGGLIKQGSSTTLFLAGPNTYTGQTNVSAGVLDISGGSLATGNIAIASGATLQASGSAGTIKFNIAGDTPDVFTNAGTLGISNLDLALNVTGTQNNSSYTIESGVYSGTAFAAVTYNGGALPAGDSISYGANSITLNLVPEPASLGLLAMAGVGLLGRRRLRH
jgi:autotransporter-associated beta strand protein